MLRQGKVPNGTVCYLHRTVFGNETILTHDHNISVSVTSALVQLERDLRGFPVQINFFKSILDFTNFFNLIHFTPIHTDLKSFHIQ